MNEPNPTPEKVYLTTAEVAELLGLSKAKIMRMVADAKFPDPDMRVSSQTRKYWHREVVMRWLEKGVKPH